MAVTEEIEALIVIRVICKHGDVKTTIRTDRPGIPTGLVETHDREQSRCAPHFVRLDRDADL